VPSSCCERCVKPPIPMVMSVRLRHPNKILKRIDIGRRSSMHAVRSYRTLTVTNIFGWISQRTSNVPATGNGTERIPPWFALPN
jgi:hypothetical protein